MTDANLMDADCIHGNTWWECDICEIMDKMEEAINDDRTDASPVGGNRESE